MFETLYQKFDSDWFWNDVKSLNKEAEAAFQALAKRKASMEEIQRNSVKFKTKLKVLVKDAKKSGYTDSEITDTLIQASGMKVTAEYAKEVSKKPNIFTSLLRNVGIAATPKLTKEAIEKASKQRSTNLVRSLRVAKNTLASINNERIRDSNKRWGADYSLVVSTMVLGFAIAASAGPVIMAVAGTLAAIDATRAAAAYVRAKLRESGYAKRKARVNEKIAAISKKYTYKKLVNGKVRYFYD